MSNFRRLNSSFLQFVFAACIVLLLVLETSAKRLPIKIYTSADGLGSGFVDNLYRDRRGFMWFCTRDGLSRFDGSEFVTYQVGEPGSAPGFESIYETSKGIYWISTTAGTYRFDPNNRPKSPSDPYRLNAEFITRARGAFYEDQNGTVWAASGTLYKIEEHDGKAVWVPNPISVPGMEGTNIRTYEIEGSADGSLWINGDRGLVRMLPDSRIVFYRDDQVIVTGEASMLADRSGRVWLIRGNRVLVIKPEAIESITEPGPTIVRSLEPTGTHPIKVNSSLELPGGAGTITQLIDRDLIQKESAKRVFQSSNGDVWLSSEDNLISFSSGSTNLITAVAGLPNVNGRMAEDNSGNLWISGQSALARLDPHGFVTYDRSDGLNSVRFFSIGEFDDGLYFGQASFELSRFDGTKFETVRPGIKLETRMLWTSRFLFRSSDGDWWLTSGDGLFRFSGVQKFADLNGRTPSKVYTKADGLPGGGAFQIFEDPRGDIWVSTRGLDAGEIGLGRLKKGADGFAAFGKEQGYPEGRSPSSFAVDSFGNLWFGFYEGGLARYDGDRFKVFSAEDGLPPFGVISDLLLDQKGRLWIASSNFGVLRLDDTSSAKPAFVSIGLDKGLRSSNVRTLTQDRFGRIYAGTARGVDRISPDTLRIKNYTVADGLAADFVVDSLCDRNGDLWFATNQGLSRLTPVPDEKVDPPRVLLGGVSIAGVERPVSQVGDTAFEPGELSASENNLQIRFMGLDFRAGESLRFQYRLEGADLDWSAPSRDTAVSYANLRPGSYKFLVRAVNSEGAVSENPATVSFVILAPIWQRWWFVLLATVAVFAVVFMFYRYRIARLHEVNAALESAQRAGERVRRMREERIVELERVRSRIATDLHDDIGASLTQISILSEVARSSGAKNGNIGEPLAKITEVSNDLVGTMSDIVWSINPAKDHLGDLTQRMRRFASDVLSEKGVRVSFRLPDDSERESLVNSNVRREVFLVFKEAVNNIAKHSGAANAEIELRISRIEIELSVRDDGKGFAFEAEDAGEGASGNGLLSMERRATEMGGVLVIDSSAGKGTKVFLRLPREQSFDESLIPNIDERRA